MTLFVTSRQGSAILDVNLDILAIYATNVSIMFRKWFTEIVFFLCVINIGLGNVLKCHLYFVDCPPGYYGNKCEKACVGNCLNNSICDHIDGTCSDGCKAGFIGQWCDAGKNNFIPPPPSLNLLDFFCALRVGEWSGLVISFCLKFCSKIFMSCGDITITGDNPLLGVIFFTHLVSHGPRFFLHSHLRYV